MGAERQCVAEVAAFGARLAESQTTLADQFVVAERGLSRRLYEAELANMERFGVELREHRAAELTLSRKHGAELQDGQAAELALAERLSVELREQQCRVDGAEAAAADAAAAARAAL